MEDILHGKISKQRLGKWLDEMEEEKKFRSFIKGKIGVNELFDRDKEMKKQMQEEKYGEERNKDLA